MYQGRQVNLSRTPQKREQVKPAPTVSASGGDVTGLQDQIDDLLARVAVLEAQVVDHETRIAALEP